jgi:hypothetical protein
MFTPLFCHWMRCRRGTPNPWAAFEQGAWLAELELLELGEALRRRARQAGGYHGELFDLMLTIADVLEQEHGWSLEQSEAWLQRMGVGEEP